MKTFDVSVIGGGPAGLTAARELSKSGLRVLLVEKEKIGRCSRSWITWHDDLLQKGFEDTVVNKIPSLVFRSFLGGEHRFSHAPSAIVDPKKLLARLRAQAEDAGVEIHERETFLRYREDGDAVCIETDKQCYRNRYCIDASGAYSRIQYGLSGRLPQNGLMGCYAVEVEKLKISDAGTAYIFDAAFPGKDYFWFLPYSSSKALVGCFFFEELNGTTLPRAQEALARYMKCMRIYGRVTSVIRGNIPLTERRHLRNGRIFFAGDALSSPLPSSGYGLLRAIREAEILAREMAGGFASGRISYEPAIIEARYPGFELHYLASDMLKNINDPLLDKSIRQMNRIDPAFIAHFLRGDDLSIIFSAQMISAIYETFSLQEIASMALRHDYKEFLLHIVRIYPKATPAVIKKTLNSLVSRLFKKR